MMHLLSRLRIPTLLGLGVILVGIGAGVYTVMQGRTSFISQASPDQTPKNITLTNIEDESITISWQTTAKVPGFVSFGISANDQTALDDRDSKSPQERYVHHVTMKHLTPQTTYSYKIFSGKQISEQSKFTTAAVRGSQNGFSPVIGSVLEGRQPLLEGMVYLSIAGGVIQSAPVKDLGNFVIAINKMRKQDLSEVLKLEEGQSAKLTVVSDKGQASALLHLTRAGVVVGSLKIGQDLDLTQSSATPVPVPISAANIYDLNKDGFINANDYAVALKNKGKSVKSVRSDLNTDRVIDQKYLDELVRQVNGQKLP